MDPDRYDYARRFYLLLVGLILFLILLAVVFDMAWVAGH